MIVVLNTCPFCGDEPDFYETDDGKWHICCLNMKSDDEDCLLSTVDHDFEFDTLEDMASAWNKRQEQTQGHKRIS